MNVATIQDVIDALRKNGFIYEVIVAQKEDYLDLEKSTIHKFGKWTGWVNGANFFKLFFKEELDAIMAKMILS